MNPIGSQRLLICRFFQVDKISSKKGFDGNETKTLLTSTDSRSSRKARNFLVRSAETRFFTGSAIKCLTWNTLRVRFPSWRPNAASGPLFELRVYPQPGGLCRIFLTLGVHCLHVKLAQASGSLLDTADSRLPLYAFASASLSYNHPVPAHTIPVSSNVAMSQPTFFRFPI
jgi:hypothetical protein